jgi:hypothetical protein
VLAARILEDADLIAEMLALVPEGREDWRPDWPVTGGDPPFPVARLREHLAESLAGICACLDRLHPSHRARPCDFDGLRQMARDGFALLCDRELTASLPTHFAPEGAPFLDTLLINWKHLVHHGYQLFVYLKLMGVPVSTRHLFRFR